MKPIQAIVPALALLLVCVAAWAKPPVLGPGDTENPTEIRAGNAEAFSIKYQQAQGDPPKSLFMVVQTPEGNTVRVPAPPPVGDPTSGENITWNYRPQGSGTYRYHFEATSSTGASVRYPPGEDLQFVSVSLVTKLIILAVGLLIALLFLPFIVYVATRALNKRGDPAAAARVALVIGVAASLGLMLCLFLIKGFEYAWLGWALAVLSVLSIFVVLFSRRRVA